MAENKSSFILYTDIIEIVEKLNDEQAGVLFKHILRYVNDLNPEAPDLMTDLVFTPIKQALKRDLRKYEKYVEKQRENGKKGGRPKAKKTQKTQAFFSKPKKADSVIVNDNDNVNDSVISKKEKKIEKKESHPMVKFVESNLPYIHKIKDQLTDEQADKLLNKYPRDLIREKLEALNNKKDCHKNYNSVYLTVNNWCKLSIKDKQTQKGVVMSSYKKDQLS
jgi:hypothetical protein